MALTKLTTDLIDGSLGTDWQTTPKTAAFTATAGEGYLVDTSSAAITVTLPAAPSAGDEIIIVDYASNAGTNNITLDPGTLNLRGATDDLVLSTNNQTAKLLYSGATKGWLVTTEAGAGTAAAATPGLTVDYLVVAGGGGGGYSYGGGGGAGGFITSFGTVGSGGGASAESIQVLNTSSNYTVTVGAGGSAADVNGSGTNGSNSVFSSITSIGGGYGGNNTNTIGGNGGSGGGGMGSDGSAAGGSGTTNQGFSGGLGAGTAGAQDNRGGGGGGASEVGTGGKNSTPNGGDGLANSISGSSLNYAGGGGGSKHPVGGTYGAGGIGGGGAAGNTATAGSTNTGGGGGGTISGTAASGGSGIVIVRYPDVYDITVGSGLTTGTLNTTVGSDEKYTTFTAGTGTISFS